MELSIPRCSQRHPSTWYDMAHNVLHTVLSLCVANSPPGPVQEELFDDLDEQGEQLLNSLHLGPAEEEPVRRGAASRANSVRFDESALHGSSWGGHNSRHSGDFGPVRPGSSLMMERSLSHKSDGRHSSAGHSVHSHVSVASGRASSLGLDTNFAVGDDDDASLDIPEPPASFFVLGSVPSIVRCWLTTNYAHDTLLYADICTGSQRSTIDYSLLKELDLLDEIERDSDGTLRARLHVYFAEATVIQHNTRSHSPERSVPSMAVSFEITGVEGVPEPTKPGIRIFIGSDALRAHSADVLFSQNTMVLYGDDRSRLKVPFIRPEDETIFRHISTTNVAPEKPKLNANAAPFILGEAPTTDNHEASSAREVLSEREEESHPSSPASLIAPQSDFQKTPATSGAESSAESEKSSRYRNDADSSIKDGSNTSETSRRESASGIWGSWRSNGTNGVDGAGREGGLLSGYQPATRGSRNMKVLKSQKTAPASTRTGASFEPSTPTTTKSGESRKKGPVGVAGDGGAHGSVRWDTKRAVSSGAEAKSASQSTSRETREPRNSQTLPRGVNPVGVASAFSWMTPPAKSKPSTTAQ